ncbi:hypothetical protein E2C01_019532 [Portunus trituberculatus]|uniref:E3 ubiquitin-protein ligase APD1-4 N-terminal domain-containing protein n=1 Tax=Portunus trituberculatus TaxID=210409 RepID=A0A5B7DZL8_PORTR|nr:hypothetical protein [Portunus trituberculatus]
MSVSLRASLWHQLCQLCYVVLVVQEAVRLPSRPKSQPHTQGLKGPAAVQAVKRDSQTPQICYTARSLSVFSFTGQLLRGPRRVVRLCVFALLLPAVLITVPLYVRLVLYPPAHYPMMPTDQRLLSRHASSFWCQAQSTHMNGSFTSYLTSGRPELRPDRRTYVMLNHLRARDDVKEYWGFYLLRGSTVTISSCAR